MILLTEWDASVIIEAHLKRNPFYCKLSAELIDNLIDKVCNYVLEVDIPSNILFKKLEYDSDLLEYFL